MAQERTISAIEPQQRKRDRMNLYLDGEFAMGVNAAVVVSLGLSVGQRIDEEHLNDIVRQESLNKAKDRAFNLLSYRARSEKEIRDRLALAGYETDIVDEVVSRLYALNYLDDQDFARKFISDRQAERPAGRRALAWELRRKGLDAETVETAVAGMDDDTERAAALEAAGARAARYVNMEPQDARRKLGAFLQRRGFAWDTINDVLGVVLTPKHAD
ncbi:MAG TPA: RecX family transcriptional regulator [Armatimonadota bacterium]|jgi:regulatory protein